MVNNDSLQSSYKVSKIESLRLSLSLARGKMKHEQDTKMWIMIVNVCTNDWSWSSSCNSSDASDPHDSTCKLQIGFKIPLHIASSCPIDSYFQACCDGNFLSFFSGTGGSTRGHTTREPAIGISRCHYAGQDHINDYKVIYQYAASIIINHYHSSHRKSFDFDLGLSFSPKGWPFFDILWAQNSIHGNELKTSRFGSKILSGCNMETPFY